MFICQVSSKQPAEAVIGVLSYLPFHILCSSESEIFQGPRKSKLSQQLSLPLFVCPVFSPLMEHNCWTCVPLCSLSTVMGDCEVIWLCFIPPNPKLCRWFVILQWPPFHVFIVNDKLCFCTTTPGTSANSKNQSVFHLHWSWSGVAKIRDHQVSWLKIPQYCVLHLQFNIIMLLFLCCINYICIDSKLKSFE